jgi:hypothetical protein
MASVISALHYRLQPAPIEPTTQQLAQENMAQDLAVVGSVVGHPPENTLFQRADDHNQLNIRELAETDPEIAENVRIRPPSGYIPPQIPRMM